MSEERFEVVVIGTGIAGTCAALEALEAGASVLMLDASKTAGGSSRLSSGMIMAAQTRFQEERGIKDHPESLYAYYLAVNRHSIQKSVARRLCYESGPTIHWLADRGVEIIDLFYSGEESAPRGHVTRGGQAILDSLNGRLQNFPRLDVALGSRVERLLLRNGTVCGVATEDYEMAAGAVVIATGGFGANLDIMSRWQPRMLTEAAGSVHYVGADGAQGDSIRLGVQVGAQIAGEGRAFRTPYGPLTGSYLPGYAVVVNRLGRRYYDETSTYGVGDNLLAQQPGAIAYVILDDATKRAMQREADVLKYLKVLVPGSEVSIRAWTSKGMDELVAAGTVTSAGSLEDLARRIGLPPANLVGTVERYNQGVTAGEDADYLKNPDWLRPVSTPPFYASPLKLSIFGLTAAGVRIDHNASVLHQTGRSIPGLFAAGECTGGVIGDVYVGSGNALASATVFGRVAGRMAAATALGAAH